MVRVLPSTDIFLPSIDEILFMVDRAKYDQLVAEYGEDLVQGVDQDFGSVLVTGVTPQHCLRSTIEFKTRLIV